MYQGPEQELVPGLEQKLVHLVSTKYKKDTYYAKKNTLYRYQKI